jgi:hopene-associated glycosyltransferase HpnB
VSGELVALGVLATLPVAAWLGVLAHPARPWELRPVAEDEPPPPEPSRWPSVAIVVPARNEAQTIPQTLPHLLDQDSPGPWWLGLVDDRSRDGTADAARRAAGSDGRLRVLAGTPLPPGWVGKVWALEQGSRHADAREPEYLLLTDADIRHAPGSLRRLVAESEAAGLALNSRMARLRCRSRAERLLIPAFVFFFALLYPPRRVNGRRGPAAAAGGCMLLRRDALQRAGGFASLRGATIDDLALARLMKRELGLPLRLALSREAVVSVRAYRDLGPIWRMVRRSAFTQLRRSWALLLGVLAGLALLFVVPPLALVGGLALLGPKPAAGAWIAGSGALALALTALAYRRATGFFGLGAAWAWTLPLAGTLYAGMTLDSALRDRRARPVEWRER